MQTLPSPIYRRDISGEIEKYLGSDNIIVLHGSRQVGKTYLLYALSQKLQKEKKQVLFLDLEDARLVEILDKGVDSFLDYLRGEGIGFSQKSYIFIDEIQYLSNPSSFLKLIADHQKQIQLIVSGSSSFAIRKKFSDSLVGRTVNFEIYNLSFSELLRFKKIEIDLEKLSSPVHLEKARAAYQEYLLYGGYPKVVLENSLEKKEKYLLQIVQTYIERDIRDLAGIKNLKKFNQLLRLLASQSGQLLNIASLAAVSGLARETVENYLFILENTYIIKLLPVFSRSAKVEVVKAPKIFFYDTGLMQILWLRNLTGNILGGMFETGLFAQLVKKYGADKLYFWRTKNQTEVDFILEDKGRLVPFEAKLSFRNAKNGALSSFQNRYQSADGKIVGLFGQKTKNHHFFPWEI